MGESKRDLRWSVEQRLEFVEYRLFWEGMIRRGDLTGRFEVSVPQASGDLSTYKEFAPNNMKYDGSCKAYVPTSNFKPIFYEPSASGYFTQLRLISDGVCGSEDTWFGWLPPFDMVPLVRRRASPAKLRKVLKAIRQGRALYIQYQSVGRPEPIRRWIAPHGLGFDGFRWHARAWCHRNEDFRDFVLARMLSVDRDREEKIDPTSDLEWQNKVKFRIGPNPKLEIAAQQAIALDFGMKNGELELTSRVCMSWYVEKHLGLDLDQYSIPPERQHIVLLNRDEIEQAREKASAEAGQL